MDPNPGYIYRIRFEVWFLLSVPSCMNPGWVLGRHLPAEARVLCHKQGRDIQVMQETVGRTQGELRRPYFFLNRQIVKKPKAGRFNLFKMGLKFDDKIRQRKCLKIDVFGPSSNSSKCFFYYRFTLDDVFFLVFVHSHRGRSKKSWLPTYKSSAVISTSNRIQWTFLCFTTSNRFPVLVINLSRFSSCNLWNQRTWFLKRSPSRTSEGLVVFICALKGLNCCVVMEMESLEWLLELFRMLL